MGNELVVVPGAELVAVALQPQHPAWCVERAGDGRDGSLTAVAQVPDHLAGAGHVVGGDVPDLALVPERQTAGDGRDAFAQQRADDRVPRVRRDQQDAVHMAAW